MNKYNADFFIPVIIDGETFYLDIDTGDPYGIYFPDSITRIKKTDEYQEIISDERVTDKYHLVKTGSITILDETYTGLSVMTNSIYSVGTDPVYSDLGILGLDFLFDYRDLREGKASGLYFEPNTPIAERNYGFFSFIKNVPEFGILNFGFNEKGLVYPQRNKKHCRIRYCRSAPRYGNHKNKRDANH
ncbi:hypothetical protein FACS189473_1930 [Spirochaetia bacterium]|nr:hypothetical protein FACS189473_1930 [Spirochaetia bacterium]